MVKQRFRKIALLLFVSSLSQPAASAVVVNEVMVNEPGSFTTREWIELFNDSQSPVLLSELQIIHGSDTIRINSSSPLLSQQFVVVTRSLAAFDDVWGNGSGSWGDGPGETYPLYPGSFSLPNQRDSIIVFSQGERSVLTYPDGGADGVSWERVSSASDESKQSVALSGSTPGRINSVSFPSDNLSVRLLDAQSEPDNSTRLDFIVENSGRNPHLANALNIYANPVIDSVTWTITDGEFLGALPFRALDSATADTVSLSVTLTGMYPLVGAELTVADDRPEDNIIGALVPGVLFPPVVLTEFLPDPVSPLSVEWIEIKNISRSVINLSGWMIGDELATSEIPPQGLGLAPGEYLIFTEDRDRFLAEYPLINARVIEPTPWRTLNNFGDVVRLIDSLGYTSDSVSYDVGWGENITWAREESEPDYIPTDWGRSAKPGGFPGAPNVTLMIAQAAEIALTVAPNPFSPDGDGFEDFTLIQLESPPGDELIVRIYNRDGAPVRTLVKTAPFSGGVTWDGLTDTGRRAPVDIYIVFVTVDGAQEFKTTVVVAR